MKKGKKVGYKESTCFVCPTYVQHVFTADDGNLTPPPPPVSYTLTIVQQLQLGNSHLVIGYLVT